MKTYKLYAQQDGKNATLYGEYFTLDQVREQLARIIYNDKSDDAMWIGDADERDSMIESYFADMLENEEMTPEEFENIKTTWMALDTFPCLWYGDDTFETAYDETPDHITARCDNYSYTCQK